MIGQETVLSVNSDYTIYAGDQNAACFPDVSAIASYSKFTRTSYCRGLFDGLLHVRYFKLKRMREYRVEIVNFFNAHVSRHQDGRI